MKVGVIVFSQTGNTFAVAQKFQEKLVSLGHTATVERVTVIGKTHPGSKDFQLDSIPRTDNYDAFVFGAPVQAFSLASAMAEYLNQLPAQAGKKAALFVTKQLPFSWTGGGRAIGQMKRICASKGVTVTGNEIIIWPKVRRDLSHIEAVDRLCKLI
ncbi:MAG TPA: hypothetical protein VLH40_08580 [Atribacteraceae bacterium]|nr:hypothetical protein [Atribacteraceae bacterium]